MRVALVLPGRHDWRTMRAAALEAEGCRRRRRAPPEHLAYGLLGTRQLEAWTTMAALAANTSGVGLGIGRLSAWPPSMLIRRSAHAVGASVAQCRARAHRITSGC